MCLYGHCCSSCAHLQPNQSLVQPYCPYPTLPLKCAEALTTTAPSPPLCPNMFVCALKIHFTLTGTLQDSPNALHHRQCRRYYHLPYHCHCHYLCCCIMQEEKLVDLCSPSLSCTARWSGFLSPCLKT